MENLEEYMHAGKAASCPSDEAIELKLRRECGLLWDGLSSGFATSTNDAIRDPLATSMKFTASLVGAALLSKAWVSNGATGLAARGASSALGVMTLSESMRIDRVRDICNALDETWQNGEHMDANLLTMQRQLGSLAFDTSVALAGGILGSAMAVPAFRSCTNVREWPQLASEISHPFGENIRYRSTANGAELRLNTGETYKWNGVRPIFETRQTAGGAHITEFGDGSKLTILPDKQVEFIGAIPGNKLIAKSDLVNDIHIREFDRLVGKSAQRQWERTYNFGDGTIVVQYPRSDYQITTSRGAGRAFDRDGNFLDLAGKSIEENLGRVPSGGKLPRNATVEALPNGERRVVFDDKTQMMIDQNGHVRVKGSMWSPQF